MNKLNLVDGIFILLVICASSKAGNISADEAYTTDNDGVAIVELTRRADNGDPDALYALGWKYEFGRGVSLNLNEAIRLYQLASVNISDRPCNKLSCETPFMAKKRINIINRILQSESKGVNRVDRAHEYYQFYVDSLTYASAALSGSNERYVAQHYMEEAKTSLEEMVADDIRYAIYLLGKINYHEGVANTEIAITESNIPKDISFTFLYEDLAKKSFKKAFEMLSTAAERGSTSAMFYLGEMHANGYGVNKSGLVALEHYYDSGHGDFEAGYREDALLALEKMLEIFPEHFLTKQLAAEIYGFKQKSQGPSQYTEIPQQSAQIQESDNTPDATVKWTQERLASRGYDAGSADGVFGQKTQTAIQEFQSDNGLPSTGAISDELIEILKTVKPKLRTLKIAATGSGFVRGSEGEILTNYHVIHECLEIRVAPSQNAVQLVATDANNDLALLKSDSAFKERGKFRGNSGLRQGDQVTVIGYPLRGLLASGPSVTTGTISALAGVGNDTRLLQISAPVQAGNSGGPLFDEFGNVVGVVVSKLDAVEVASITGDFPQNINFAINASIAKNFLDSNNVKYDVSSSAERLSTADITDKAREFTKLIECWK